MQDKKPFNKQGERHGHWETYFSNGQLSFIGEYKNNIPIGVHKTYYLDGNMDAIDEYFDDGIHYSKSSYSHKVICYEGYYKNGFEIGYWYENFNSRPNEHFYYAR